jgi:hypothetical protein
MAIIKKKDIKKFKVESKKPIEELIDSDGSEISGDKPEFVNNSEIEVSPQETSADYADMAIQPNRGYYGYSGNNYSHGNSHLREVAKQKMKQLIEDTLSNKENTDINNNQIPDLDELNKRKNKPTITSNTKSFIKHILSVPLDGEDKAMVLNYILININTEDISDNFKNILRNTI